MGTRHFFFTFSIFLLFIATMTPAHALNLESLVMPGELIQGHAKYEEDCDKCHESFKKTSQRRLCLDCHEETADDIKAKTGLHGRDSRIRKVECRECHSDHLGRGADIVQFNKNLFNHDQTDFKLKDGHLRPACGACHKADKPYREAPSKCYDCHKERDVHKEKFGKKCGQCHSESNWRKHKFDHSKTDYALTGKHKKVSCNLCHPNQRYKDIPSRCNDCHQLNDVHNKRYGPKCDTCHTTKGWKGFNFDHDKKTKFALHGKHKDATCSSCHQTDYKKKLKTKCFACHKKQDAHKGALGKTCKNCHNEQSWRKHRFKHDNFKKTACYDCHKADDSHKGRYGKKCSTCHKTEAWDKASFKHDKDTKFPLRGKHKDAACVLCHKGDAANEKDKTACRQCHALDDVHNQKLGKQCNNCHNEKGWRERVRFDHDLSAFPLIGLHATTPCEACHMDDVYKDTQSACNACHEPDDKHKRRLGPKCGSCHNPNSWSFWQFNHDRQTDFKLKDAHKEIVCEACHKSRVEKEIKLDKTCISCHRLDDIHNGRFGAQCDRCHNEKDFREISVTR